MAKHDQKGRSTGDAKHVRFYWWLLESEAYRALSPSARALLIELYALYNSQNNGEMFLGVRDAAKLTNVSKATAARAFSELEVRGFIRAKQRGSFDYKKRHATTWILTEYEYAGRAPTKDFKRWQSGMNLKPGITGETDGTAGETVSKKRNSKTSKNDADGIAGETVIPFRAS